jgi:SAM-dependent methyltransferase
MTDTSASLGAVGTSRRACPICGAPGVLEVERSFDADRVGSHTFASRKSPELMHWSMALCQRCDLLFAIDPPGFEALKDAYQEAAFDAGRESEAAAKTYEQVVCRDVVPSCATGVASMSVLDVGCGDGTFLERMLDLGVASVVGIEISEEPIRRASGRIRDSIVPCMIEDFDGTGFSLATTFQVLEHFADPVAVMRRLGVAVEPGGFVLGVVHDRRSPVNRALRHKSPIWDIEHLQLFSQRSVRALVSAAGLDFVSMRHITNVYPLDYWLKLSPVPSSLRLFVEKAARPGGHDIPLPLRVGNLAFVARRRA